MNLNKDKEKVVTFKWGKGMCLFVGATATGIGVSSSYAHSYGLATMCFIIGTCLLIHTGVMYLSGSDN